MPGIETIATGVAAAILGVALAVEKLEKRGLIHSLGVGSEPPDWAKRQNELLVLIAKQIDGIDEQQAADYLGHSTEPSIEDVVATD